MDFGILNPDDPDFGLLTDPTNHPGNDPDVPLIKSEHEELDPACCCEDVDFCCGRESPGGSTNPFPNNLTLTLTNVADCACIEGHTITLAWNGTIWEGTGAEIDGTCQADIATWQLTCSEDGSAPGNQCNDFKLIMTGGAGPCVTANDFANSGCVCDPLFLEFTINATGIGCCDSFTGAGTILATITE